MTDKDNNPSAVEAREALDAVRLAQGKVSEQVAHANWRYDIVYSGLVGVMIASQGLPFPWGTATIGICVFGLVMLAKTWADRTGVWVSGVTPKRARWVAIFLGLLLGGMMVGVLLLTRKTGLWQIPVGAGIVGALIAYGASHLWWRVYRAETGGRA